MCKYVLYSMCVFRSTSSARFPLCQSVATMEHPGLAQPSISRLPWLTRERTHSVQRKPRPPATLLKGYSCCLRGHRAKKIFFPKIQHRKQVVLLRHFLSFTACHTQLIAIWEDINSSHFHEFIGHKFYICVMLETIFPLVRALKS